MADKKEYTISKVIESQVKEDVDLPFKDGIVKVRIYPVRFGELKLIARAKAGKDSYAQSEEIMVRFAKKLEKDQDGKVQEVEFQKSELSSLPPGFVNSLMDAINTHSGLGVNIEDLKKSYPPM